MSTTDDELREGPQPQPADEAIANALAQGQEGEGRPAEEPPGQNSPMGKGGQGAGMTNPANQQPDRSQERFRELRVS